ncbi:MAG: hypothetical protein ACOCNT_00585 [Bacteroidales bacterium]
MKKYLFLFVAFLYALTGKAAQTDVLTDQMYTPAELQGATTTLRIALRNMHASDYTTYYCGSGKAAFTAAYTVLLEPVTEGVAGTYYLRLANPTAAQGEGYFGTTGPANYGSKGNAMQFTIVHPYVGGTGVEEYNNSNEWTGRTAENLVRFICSDGTKTLNSSQTAYNTGRGVFTVFEVYKVEQQDEPTIETISAAIATEEEFVDGGKYIIHGAGITNAYFYEKDHTCAASGITANPNKRIGYSTTKPAVGSTDFTYIFTLEKEIVGGVAQYAFRTNSGGYIDGVDHRATTGGDPIHTTETKCTFTLTRDGNHWRVNSTVANQNRKQWNTGGADTGGLVLFTAGDANGIIDFYEVNHNSVADKTVSFSYYAGGTLLGVENKTFAASTPVSVTVPDYVEVTSTDPADLSTVADGGTVSVSTAMKADCPFKVSEAAEAADAVWMNWQIQRSPAKWVYAGEGDTGVKVTAAATQLEADRYQWCMVGDWFNGFTLYNKYTKKQIAATAPAANNGANTLTLADSGTSRFALVQNGTDYYFQLKGAENTYISNYSNNNVTDLYVWRSTSNIGDGGSKFAVVAAPTEETILANWQAAVAAATEGNYVNCYTAEAKAAAAAATTIAEAKAVKPVTFDVNSYYRIICVSPKDAGTTGQGAATINTLTFDGIQYFDGSGTANKMLRPICAEASEQNIGQIWQFKATGTEGVYTLYNPNAAQYVGGVTNVTNGRLKMADTGDELELVPYAAANHQFKIHHYGTDNENCMFAENNTSNGYTLSNWENGANSASAWYLLPVSTFEVALNAAGTDYWASLYLPFDATLPASGLEAYYGKAKEGGALKMEQATAVPANQGVVLKGTAETYTLSIAAAAVTPIESNVLQGTNKLLEGITSDDYYTLGAVGGVVGFYHPSATKLKANRAYMAAVGGGVNAFTLVFDEGTETGISHIETAQGAADVYYDLSGRRIATPGKGLYIKNGKKVLVK